MLPRGELTRDQLSALLIGYVNTAADLTGLKWKITTVICRENLLSFSENA